MLKGKSKAVRLPPAAQGPEEYTSKPEKAMVSDAAASLLRGKSKQGTIGAAPPETIPFLIERVSSNETNALAYEADPTGTKVTWTFVTWKEYMAEVKQAARAFVALGLQPCESVSILGFNAKEWLVADLACILAGGFVSGIYSTNGAEACHYILEHSKCSICVVEDQKQLDKVALVSTRLPHLKAVVQYASGNVGDVPGCKSMRWQTDFLALGAAAPAADLVLQKRASHMDAGQCCTLIYTSGTTGNPKAVMISHDAITWVVRSFATMIRFGCAPGGKERYVSYLPLSHIAAQAIDIYAGLFTVGRSLELSEKDIRGELQAVPMVNEATLYFARADALKGSLKQTLCASRPTVFFGVPRVWEKFAEALQAVGAKTTGTKKKISVWAKGVALAKYQRNRADAKAAGFEGLAKPLLRGVSEKLALKILSKVHAAIGLDKAHFLFTGAAPIAVSTLEYFGSLGLIINETFGMSEVAGPAAVTLNEFYAPGTCGPALPGVEIKIEHLKGRDKEGEGEVCFRGRSVMMGYLYDEAKSADAIDADGWCHSGDIGTLLSLKTGAAPMLRITGRVKEMLVTAGGENVAPVPIEDALKGLLSAISCAVVVGDKLKFLSVLITLKQQANDVTGSFDDVLIGDAALVNPEVSTAAGAAKDLAFKKYLADGLAKYNKKAVSSAQMVQKFAILPRDFSQATGELTPTLKLKRAFVVEKYADTLHDLYKDGSKSAVW
ncbi:hypothetical protein M885DRAFT_553996 [Pelagophyceae sp. CCMP2097]|nr:hypothetical protein M885DRAFT_553996 [Pelagophyceae sp. CCMP2097]